MKTEWIRAVAVGFFIVCLAGFSSCSRPGDESWMNITSFRQGEGEELTAVSSINSVLLDYSTETVDIGMTNFSTTAQGTLPGTGIIINRVRINYIFGDYSSKIPSFDYAVRYFLPSGDGEDGSQEVTIEDVPIVPLSLKQWFLNNANFPAGISCCRFTVEAEITVFGRTDEGGDLSASGNLTIIFN